MPLVRLACLSLTVALFLSSAHANSLNDTGQLRCFDDTDISTGTVSDGSTNPEDPGFEAQDCSLGASAADAVGVQVKIGDSSVAGRDYTKIANDGSELPATATLGPNPGDWRCTRDNVTGLTWLLRLNDGSLGDQDHRYSYGSNANNEGDTCEGTATPCNTDPVVQNANTNQLCGADDWVIPTPAQFESLFAYHDPAGSDNLIDRSWFPDQSNDGVNLFIFWTQSPQDTFDPPSYWVADFGSGSISFSGAESAAYLRLVRQAPAPVSPRFSTSEPTAGEVVVEDAQTGLMWKQCPQGLSGADCATGTRDALDWSGALTAAGTESFANFNDWRLPNIIELASIRDYTPVNFGVVTLLGEFAGSTYTDTYWSATNDPRLTWLDLALTYQYADSTAQNSRFKTEFLAVRLVRGGSFLGAHEPGNDTTPDAFSFTAKDAPPDTLVESNEAITVAGITGVTSFKVTGAAQSAFSINGGSWSSGVGAVQNGDTVLVRHQSAATIGDTATTTLNIGGVTADFTSTATAPPDAPTITVESLPNTQFLVNHNRDVVNFHSPDITLRISDLSQSDATLEVTAKPLDNAVLLPEENIKKVSSSTESLVKYAFQPSSDQKGSVTIEFVVTNDDGLTDSEQVTVTFDGNLAPSAVYSHSSPKEINEPAGSEFTVSGYILDQNPGDGEDDQTIHHEIIAISSGDDITAEVLPEVDQEGNISFTVPDVDLPFTLVTWPVDSGAGDASRCTGENRSAYYRPSLGEINREDPASPGDALNKKQGPCGSVHSLAPMQVWVQSAPAYLVTFRVDDPLVSSRDSRFLIPDGGSTERTASLQISYRISLKNVGLEAIEGATVTVPASAQLSDTTWSCGTTHGDCSVASGQGAVETVVDLDVDEVAEIIITGTLPATTGYVSLTPKVTFPDGVEGWVPGNGVRKIDVVSNGYIFHSGFE